MMCKINTFKTLFIIIIMLLSFNQLIQSIKVNTIIFKRTYKASSLICLKSFRDIPSKQRYKKWDDSTTSSERRKNYDDNNDNFNNNNNDDRIKESVNSREYIPRERISRSNDRDYNDRNIDSNKNRYQSQSYDRNNNYNNYDRPKWMDERESKGPPLYGYYDGDHLYGIAPVLAAIQANKRNITELITQEGLDPSNKKDEKAASQILALAKEKGIKMREFPKHDLNMMTENRPHQGFVLRAEPLEMKPLNALEPSTDFKCVLALDEVWDPQNFGALLRSCHFLGVDGVVVCAKNSAPLSPVVSKASAGALENMDVLATANMMRFLDKSIENGWQVIGTSIDEGSVNLVDAPLDKPTIVVLGNEGHGIRTNILRRCTQLVSIPGSGGSDKSIVDSLNVSVTGGIILHHIINAKKR